MAWRVPRKLLSGRVRTSTVALGVLFLAVLALYLEVRPAPELTTGEANRPASTQNQPSPSSEPQESPTPSPSSPDRTPTPTPTKTPADKNKHDKKPPANATREPSASPTPEDASPEGTPGG